MDPALKAILAKRQSLSSEQVLSPEDAKQNWPRAAARGGKTAGLLRSCGQRGADVGLAVGGKELHQAIRR